MHRLAFIVGAAVVAWLPLSARAQLPPPPATNTLSWNIPTQREDGTPLLVSEIAGYELSNSCAAERIVIPDALIISHALAVTLPFDCTFTISAVDTEGVRSDSSEPLRVNFNAPSAPAFNAVQIN